MIGLDLPALRAACRVGDGDGAAAVLRWGAGEPARVSGLLSWANIVDRHWMQLRRVPPPDAPSGAVLPAAVSALAGRLADIAILIGPDVSGTPVVHLGVRANGPGTGDDAVRHARRLLAPAVLLADAAEPPDGLHVLSEAATNGNCVALTLRTMAARERDDDRPLGPGLLDRLLNLPGRDWIVAVVGRALPADLLDEQLLELQAAATEASRHVTRTEQRQETLSATVTDPVLEGVMTWIAALRDVLGVARATGGWAVQVLVGTRAADDLVPAVGAVATGLPVRLRSGAHWVCDQLPIVGDAPARLSFVTSDDLAALLRPPLQSTASVEVVEPGPASRHVLTARRPLRLGTFLGLDDPCTLDVADLEGHAFVAGTTGSGKSTTVGAVLAGLWNDHGVPFLIIDPVKAEHAELSSRLRGGLQVLGATDLRLNVLEPLGDTSWSTHLGLIATAFRGSFSLPSPVPYVLRLLFDVMLDMTGHEPAITLHDLLAELDGVVTRLGYQGEVEANIRASLGTRLSVLTAPHRAEQFAAATSAGVRSLFDRPTLVHLTDVGDDEERSFLMTVLAIYVAELARQRGPVDGVAHVTVLEEAHRVLPQPSAGGDAEHGDPASVAARQLTQLLAEIRSYGESLLIVDQSPAAVARDVVRNTNLKIVHRVLDREDRGVMGGAIGLDDDTNAVLGQLAVGSALVMSRRLAGPQMVQVHATSGSTNRPTAPPAVEPVSVRPCCRGEDPAHHHHAERAGEEAEAAVALAFTSGLPAAAAWARLHTVARRHPGASLECLRAVGLRRYLRRLVRLGALPRGAVGALLEQSTGPADDEQRVGLARHIQAELRVPAGPFDGCEQCPAPCAYRPLVSTGLDGRMMRLREHLRHALPGTVTTVTADWLDATTSAYRAGLGGGVARGVAACGVLHAADAMGVGRPLNELLQEAADG